MQKQCLDDRCYDTINQLARTLNFLSRADHYIEDANRVGDAEAEKIWKTIKEDRERHADMLKELVKNEVRNNRF